MRLDPSLPASPPPLRCPNHRQRSRSCGDVAHFRGPSFLCPAHTPFLVTSSDAPVPTYTNARTLASCAHSDVVPVWGPAALHGRRRPGDESAYPSFALQRTYSARQSPPLALCLLGGVPVPAPATRVQAASRFGGGCVCVCVCVCVCRLGSDCVTVLLIRPSIPPTLPPSILPSFRRAVHLHV